MPPSLATGCARRLGHRPRPHAARSTVPLMGAYYSDRARGPRARSEEEIGEALWEAVRVLFERGIDTAVFAQDFPLSCTDGRGVYGCDRDGLLATIRVEIGDLDYDAYPKQLPPTLAIQSICWS